MVYMRKAMIPVVVWPAHRCEWENSVRSLSTAIVHLRSASPGLPAWEDLRAALVPVSGVRSVRLAVEESVVAVRYDRRSATMAEIVRALEDAGAPVAAVAQREPRRLPPRRRVTHGLHLQRGSRKLVR
jgi:copper chaperone CopZ